MFAEWLHLLPTSGLDRGAARFGFEEPECILDQNAFQMSGSINQRLVSALGLACRPGWVIADEPTKGLDAVIRNQVFAVLRQIYTEHHCSMIVITHDLALARRLCDDIRVLYMGQIIEQGPAEAVMEQPSHPYTAGLIRFEGVDIAGFDHRQCRAYHRRVQIIFQNPEASLDPSMRIRDSLLEAMAIHRLGENREERMEKIASAPISPVSGPSMWPPAPPPG